MKNLNMDKVDGLLGGNVVSEIRRMELHRVALMSAVTQSRNLAEQITNLVGETSRTALLAMQVKDLHAYSLAELNKLQIPDNSAAIQLAKQLQDSLRAEKKNIRRLLGPVENIRKSLLVDSATRRMLDDLAKPIHTSEQLARLIGATSLSSAFANPELSSIESSRESVRKMLTDVSFSSSIGQLMKSFEEVNRRWVVPKPLLDSLGTLRALKDEIGKLALPVMDSASAATLARMLGPEGIQAQLAALGINSDGSTNANYVQQEEGIGLSRKAMELMTLLSFIFALLIPILQEISSSNWQRTTDATLLALTQTNDANNVRLEENRRMMEALAKLVEKALLQEAKRQEERFVVRDRVAVVRSNPEHGSAIQGKLLPREVVRPISESGKWIEFEYYHWIYKEHRTGWAMKKYFQRVPANFEKRD